jgi:hypothetical protein
VAQVFTIEWSAAAGDDADVGRSHRSVAIDPGWYSVSARSQDQDPGLTERNISGVLSI